MEKLFASVITIGDELLIGQLVDSNSAFIGQELNRSGITVRAKYAVADEADEIIRILDAASENSQIILITGGLGPTADDITKPVLCRYFGGNMVMHQPTLEHLTYLFEKVYNRPMIERNRKQAEVPDVCRVIKNERGTAPGMIFEKNGRLYFSMPGVPSEMKAMMPVVISEVLKRFNPPAIAHRTLLTMGIGESFLAERISDFESALPANIKLAYLPNYGLVRLRLTGHGSDKNSLGEQIDGLFNELKSQLKDVLVADEDIPIEAAVGKLLQAANETVSTAESCTGGYIAQLLTSVPGSSAYYIGSVISYDNRVKKELLQVNTRTIDAHGAVSEETVREMALNATRILGTDYALAVSGIMGPSGGTAENPVGLVWIAVAHKSGTVQARAFNFRYDRRRNIEMTGATALNMLRKFVLECRGK
ncbi:MAG TPA: CinA family nicotinamide mononucleotide deamidase-related protein [Chitinophagaceae bacterium]